MELFKAKILEKCTVRLQGKDFYKVRVEDKGRELWAWDYMDSKVGDAVMIGYDSHLHNFRTAKIKE